MSSNFPLLVRYVHSKRYAILNSLDDIVMGWPFALIRHSYDIDQHRCGPELKPGDRVIYTGEDTRGFGLQHMYVYTVDYVCVDAWRTDVALRGYNGVTYNSILFVKEPGRPIS